MSVMIKDLPMDEKPREKAKKYGINNLSNAELLAILLRTGTKEVSVNDLSNCILKTFQGIKGMHNMRLPALLDIRVIGETKAITLLASLELGKRMHGEEILGKIQIKETKDVFKYYHNFFEGEKQEKFFVLFLDSRNYVINQKIIFQGTANQSFVHPRDIFQEAILNNAVKIICVHNHPTNHVQPSKEDENVTKRILECGKLLGISLLDHIILGNTSYYSFLEGGKL